MSDVLQTAREPEEQLAPIDNCPFCKGSASLKQMPNASEWYRVRCDWHHCGGTTWAILGAAEAIAAWNRRPNHGEA